MARNERAGNCWSQPPRSTPAKSRPSCSRGLGSENLDEIGDIVNALSYVLPENGGASYSVEGVVVYSRGRQPMSHVPHV
ncbi:hypothetical protein TNCT_139371, partial [Trichonephila clavata]